MSLRGPEPRPGRAPAPAPNTARHLQSPVSNAISRSARGAKATDRSLRAKRDLSSAPGGQADHGGVGALMEVTWLGFFPG
jgi:hypothetical protein